MKFTTTTTLLLLLPALLLAQKKPIEIADVARWQKIGQPLVTPNGQWVAYLLTPTTEGDNQLCLWNIRSHQTTTFARAAEPRFSADGNYLVFKIKPPLDSLKAQRRRKVKEPDLPKDSLGLYSLSTAKLQTFPQVKSYALPEKWSGWLAYQLEPEKPAAAKKDTSNVKKPEPETPKNKGKKPKKEDAKDNGSRLVLRQLASGREDTVAFVREYRFAKRGPALLLHSSGRDSGFMAGVYRYDCDNNQLTPLWRAPKAKFAQLALDDWGKQAAFLADTDTSKARIRPWKLCYWTEKQDSARVLADTNSVFLACADARWGISEYVRPEFSEDGRKMYFNIAPPPVLNDTTLLPEEIVNVEVWAWNSSRLYTEQENRLEADKKRSYPVLYHIRDERFVPLGSPELPEWRFQEQRDAELALAFTEEPYARYVQWEGAAHKDVYAVDLKKGEKTQILKDLRCKPRLSPEARYILWWNEPDTAWFAWNARNGVSVRLTDNTRTRFFDEENDTPDFPDEYGLAGWLREDAALLLYDQFDLWKIDPSGKQAPQRLTRGRESQTRYRYIRLDPEERSIAPDARLLLHFTEKISRAEGYAWLDLKTNTLSNWAPGPAVAKDTSLFSYTKSPVKAEKAATFVFSRQNYQRFPDLWCTQVPDVKFNLSDAATRVSNANPQQSEYQWGSIELVRWTSLSGEILEGLLIKPDDFDARKQYPMIVNFYEKLSDGLLQHRAPDIHRSTINFTMYASRGYLVFAPDIPYRTGHPAESAYDAVMSGVTALIQKGFVDPKRIGLQGHSWGGYQAAYLITRTNMFACAEAGAAVANMTSAYGGIRWESGLSRQFQYEHQQSRIGGTLWESPMRYLENSPLFALPKVNTPVLLLHNDNDGAVPWQQGLELFTGLRRLGKPAWMLNYNDEPHWPVKLQNRTDFQTRMQQFFDHYLQQAPLPRWMERGVPPIEKGIRQGLEPFDQKQ